MQNATELNIDKIIKQTPQLTEKENKELINLYLKSKKKNKEIYEKIILGNLALISKIAMKYFNLIQNRYTLDDLIHEGIKGLDYAINKYDEKKLKGKDKKGWAAYKYISIDGYIKRFLCDTFGNLSVNHEKRIECLKYLKIKDKLKEILDREPDINEIIDYYKKLPKKDKLKCIEFTKNKILDYESILNSDSAISIYSPVSIEEENNRPLYEKIPQSTSYEGKIIEEDCKDEDLTNIIKEALNRNRKKPYSEEKLNKFTDFILRKIGISPYIEPQTGNEIGEAYGVSHQYINETLANLFKKLKKDPYFLQLYNKYYK